MRHTNAGRQTSDTLHRWEVSMQAGLSIYLLHKVESTKALEARLHTRPVPLHPALHSLVNRCKRCRKGGGSYRQS